MLQEWNVESEWLSLLEFYPCFIWKLVKFK